MPFIASNGLTEAASSKSIAAGGMNVHYHEVGDGEPVLFLHSYGPGTTAWITFHKALGALSRHYRCILMDLPNFSKTGPIIYREGVHGLQARTAVALLDALGIEQAHWIGNSQGRQSAMVAAVNYPERVTKFVMGGSHVGTGGDRYLLANRPSEGSRATHVFQITAKVMRGKEWMCDIKEGSPDGTGWMARLSCGSEGYAYTLTSSWQIAPEGRLRETVKTCQPSRSEDAEACQGAAGRSNVYVRCNAGTRSPWFRN